MNVDPIIFILGLDGSESLKDEAGAKININYRIVHCPALHQRILEFWT